MKQINRVILAFAATSFGFACCPDPIAMDGATAAYRTEHQKHSSNSREPKPMAVDEIRWWANCHACGWASVRVSSETLAWQEGLRHQLSRPEFRFHAISVGSMSMP